LAKWDGFAMVRVSEMRGVRVACAVNRDTVINPAPARQFANS